MRTEPPLVAAAVAILVRRFPRRTDANGHTPPCHPAGGARAPAPRPVQAAAPSGDRPAEGGGGAAKASSGSTARDLAGGGQLDVRVGRGGGGGVWNSSEKATEKWVCKTKSYGRAGGRKRENEAVD